MRHLCKIVLLVQLVLFSVLLFSPIISLPNAIGMVKEYREGLENIEVLQSSVEELKTNTEARAHSLINEKSSEDLIKEISELPGVTVGSITTLKFDHGSIYAMQKITNPENLGKHQGLQVILTTDNPTETMKSLEAMGVLFEELDIYGPQNTLNLKINLYKEVNG